MFAQDSLNGTGQQPGNFYTHNISDEDSLSAQEIIEFRNKNGLPKWFARDFTKIVCLDEKCNMVHLRIYWDGAANYLKFEIPENFPLTKTDHTVFNTEDYQKLDLILSDSESILADMKMEELIVKNASEKIEGVDAITAATKPAFKNYLVTKAAFTCYTLWYTVYGPTQDKIIQIIENNADKHYLKKIFELKEPTYLLWAVKYINKYPEYHNEFYKSIFDLILSDNQFISKNAFSYFMNTRITKPETQMDLSKNFWKFQRNLQDELIIKYSSLEFINNEAYLILLEHYENNLIIAGDFRKIITSIHPENLSDKEIQNKLKTLSQGSNPFVRNLTMKLIEHK